MTGLIAAVDAAGVVGEGAGYWSYLWHGALSSLVFGFIGIVLLLVGYWLFDIITPRIDVQKELCEKNLAIGIVIAALLLGIAYVAAHVVMG
jgi:putative membrane protein